MAQGQLRLFVAAYPPIAAAQAMLQSLSMVALPLAARHRLTPAEQVHLTLQFIGTAAKAELPEIMESIRRAASGIGAFALRPRRLVSFPERGAARLIAMETDAPAALMELQRRLAQRLARRARLNAGGRFHPHLTLARFAAEAQATQVDQPVELAAFEVTEVALMQSRLLPTGAKHEAIERVPLTE